MVKYEISKTRKIILSGLFLALFIVLDRFVTINTQYLAINLSVVALMICAVILGPKYTTIVAILGDLIGSILWPFGAYFIGFTITSGITGLIYGTILYENPNKKTKHFIIRSIISNLLVLVIVNIILNSLCLKIMYGKAFIYYLSVRLATQLILFPIYSSIIIIMHRTLKDIIKKYLCEEISIGIDEYLNQFDKFTKDPTLEAMKYLMDKFDNPHQKLKCIHIAGTNGKGSVAEMINNCLINSGYRVGKFISPHLVTFNDGICINNEPIKDYDVQEILDSLSKWIEEYNKQNKIPVKWFEVITSLVFIYFAKKECDFVVLETGLGGLTDCTNIVEPLISVITKIGYDHVDILGKTIQEIATQKAGIIKKDSETVIIRQDEIMQIIEEKCKSENNKLHVLELEEIKNYKQDEKFQEFDYKNYKNVKINLRGKAQTYNAVEVLECITILKEKGYKISDEAIETGLKTVIHKARLEEISKKPLIIFDGGHNENAINNLQENIKQYYSNKKRVYIISILKTKDYKTIIQKLVQDKDAIFFFTSGNSKKRYVSKENLYREAINHVSINRIFKEELKNAIEIAKKAYKDSAIFIVGSFYVYKDVIQKGKND